MRSAEKQAPRRHGFLRTRSATAGAALLVTLGTGVVIGSLLLPTPVPATIDSRDDPIVAPVTKVSTFDPQSVNLVVEAAEPQKLTARSSGLVTSTACAPGEKAVSGTSAFSVNDQPLIYLSTARPIWRDLSIGDRGQDVEALQTELNRLGYEVTVDGRFGRSTLAAAVLMARKAGDDSARSWTGVPASVIVWLPAPSVHVETCDAMLGGTVDVGAGLATLPRTLTSAAVRPLPSAVMAGGRVVVAGDLTLPVDSNGTISSNDHLLELAQSSAYREFLDGQTVAGPGPVDRTPGTAGSAGSAISVEYRLAAPLDVLSVPAAAVFDVKGAQACVIAEGSSIPVTIADSQLGQTLIVPDKTQVVRKVSLDHRNAPPCR